MSTTKFKVTYNGNGKTGGTVPIDKSPYVSGVTVTVLGNTGNLVRTNYTFSGWNTLANGKGISYAVTSPGNTFVISKNITLYAKWTCKVTYNGNGNTGGTVPIDSKSPYVSGVTVTVLGNTGNLVRTGYDFSGWNTLANGDGSNYTVTSPGNTFDIDDNITLYAEWIVSYTVTYNGNGNTGGTVPIDSKSPYVSGVTVTVLGNTGNLVRTGYDFSGWNTLANGDGSSYTVTSPGNTFDIDDNITLYAEWTILSTYNVTNLLWGSGNQSLDDATYEKNISFVMPTKSEGKTYKYRTELISNDVVIKTTVVDWTSNATTTILNDGLVFSTAYTFKVSLVDSGNTQVLTPGDTSDSFTTPAQTYVSYNVTNFTWRGGNQSLDDTKYEKNISFTMPVKPTGKTYKYRTELISNDVVIKTTVVDWTSNATTTILNDGLVFLTAYTFKVSLVDSGNTQVLTPGVTSDSFTTPAKFIQLPPSVQYAGTINTTNVSIQKSITGLSRPQAVAVDGMTGNIFVADTGNRKIKKYDSKGIFIKEWDTAAGNDCIGIAFDRTNSLYALTQILNSYSGGSFYKYDVEGVLLRTFRVDPGNFSFNMIGCFAFDRDNNLWVSSRWDGGFNGFKSFNLTTLSLVSTINANSVYSFIMGMTFDKDNNLYYTINDGGVLKYNGGWINYGQFEGNQSYGIALDASNTIAVMTGDSGGIKTVSNTGNINNLGFGLFNFGPRGNAPGNYNHHRIMQVMPNGNILVPDMNNNRVCIFGSTAIS